MSDKSTFFWFDYILQSNTVDSRYGGLAQLDRVDNYYLSVKRKQISISNTLSSKGFPFITKFYISSFQDYYQKIEYA